MITIFSAQTQRDADIWTPDSLPADVDVNVSLLSKLYVHDEGRKINGYSSGWTISSIVVLTMRVSRWRSVEEIGTSVTRNSCGEED